MLVLGIESSCDETAMAVVEDGHRILANCIASQTDLLQQYGGVFPEQASRRHLDICQSLLKETLQQAECTLEDLDLIAVTQGPGLIGSLLVGLNFAKGLAYQSQKPLVGVNHLEAHLYAACMGQAPMLPALGLVISGGHTSCVWIKQIGDYHLIGQTQDDAIGEAFDKVARLLDLPYPGGPEIEKLAKQGDPYRFPFKPAKIKNHPLDFSFSGLKTAVLYTLRQCQEVNEQTRCDLAASFQRAAFQTLAAKIGEALKLFPAQSILLGGGVSHSQTLRCFLHDQFSLPLYWPPAGLSLDNGAMIAGLGALLYQAHPISDLNLQALTRIPFQRTMLTMTCSC